MTSSIRVRLRREETRRWVGCEIPRTVWNWTIYCIICEGLRTETNQIQNCHFDFLMQNSHAFLFSEVHLLRNIQFERNGHTGARRKCLHFQRFMLKRIKIPDSPLLLTTAGKSSNRTRTSFRIISLPAIHLFYDTTIWPFTGFMSVRLPQIPVPLMRLHSVLLLSPLINLLIVWARHTANI